MSNDQPSVEGKQTMPVVQPEQHRRAFQEIVVEYPEYKGKPYFLIKYTENGQEFIGYGTYKPEVLSEYLKEYFMPSAQPKRKGWVHIDDIYRLIAGHSNYHGDNILSALTCLAEGKKVSKPIIVLDTERTGELPAIETQQTCEYWDSESKFCALCRPSAQLDNVNEQIRRERNIAIHQLKELGYSLGEKIRAEGDCISRKATIDAINTWDKFGVDEQCRIVKWHEGLELYVHLRDVLTAIVNQPSVQPQQWIPCSERLPKERDWYLGIFKEPDTGWINPVPFICDYVGKKTAATTKECWILKDCTDREEHIDYYFDLQCVAWMPIPKLYSDNM